MLKFVASLIRDYVGEDGICARINADRFVICMKYSDNKVKGLIKTYEDAKKDERFDNCKQSSKVHTFSPANAHFFSASFLAGNGLVVS